MSKFGVARFTTLAVVLSGMLASCSSDEKNSVTGQGGETSGSGGKTGSGGKAGASSVAGHPGAGTGAVTSPGGAGGTPDTTSSAGEAGATLGAGGSDGGSAGESAEGGAGGATPPLTELSCTDAAATPTAPGGVSIRLLNATTTPLYFGKPAVECGYLFGVAMERADHTPIKAYLDNCDHSCLSVERANGCACTPDCSQVVTQIDPGKYYEVGWTATVFEAVGMPKNCYQDQSCGTDSCWHEVLATTPVTFSADLYSDKTCTAASCPDCTTGSTGTCTIISGSTVTGTKHSASLSWTGEKIATLTFN